MRYRRLLIFTILIAIISLAQACAPHSETVDLINTKVNTLEADNTKTSTEIALTQTSQFTQTRAISDIESTDIILENRWIISEGKSASLTSLLSTLDATNSNDAVSTREPEILPNTTSPKPNLKPTETQRPPEPTVFAGCPNGCTYHPPGCEIKGNISITTGEKIYHVPGGEFYDECVINPDYGERWFCTEQEAIDNGWRKSKY